MVQKLFIFVIVIGLAMSILAGVGLAGSGNRRTTVQQTMTYPVADTGQVTCYSDAGLEIACPAEGQAFYGQDAQHTGNAPSYTDNGDGTVTDNVTGLMWQQSPDMDGDGDIDTADKMTFDEAVAAADDLGLAGYDDWRLPTIKELYSLILFSGTDPSGCATAASCPDIVPFLDTDYFEFAYGDTDAGERLIDAQYWSSTEYVGTTMNGVATAFGVNFADGRIKGYPSEPAGPPGHEFTMTAFVRYVRGNAEYGINDFVDNGDGTITDQATGLMWAQDDSGTGLNWEEALAWVAQKNAEGYLGYDDWRLPDAKELQSIVGYTRAPAVTSSAAIEPIFNTTPIIDEGGETNWAFYWTSTTHANWTAVPGPFGVYVAFGEALGWMQPPTGGDYMLLDVHGAGAQRSDPKSGDPANWPYGNGPQGDVVRIYNFVRLVRDVDQPVTPTETPTPTPTITPTAMPTDSAPRAPHMIYLPLALKMYITSHSPALTSTPAATPTSAATGYILFAPLDETTTYLIDDAGETIFAWPSSYRPGNSVYLLENGSLLHTGNTGSASFDVGGAGGIVEEIGPDGTVLASFAHDTAQGRLHHDVEPLPNGNVLMLAWELKSGAEAIAAGRNPGLLADGEVWPDTVIEVDMATGKVVWEWHAWDHLVQQYDAGQANYGLVADHPELIDVNYYGPGAPSGDADWMHTNAIDYNTDLDQILLSVRSLSEIWVIDHSTTTAEAAGHTGGHSGMGGDLLYRWGNPAAYGAGDAADQQLFVQHDAQWIPDGYPGAGNILIFNNGTGRSGGNYSSVDEIIPPVDAAGNYIGDGPASAAWTYTAAIPTSFYAANISGAQRLPDGSTLVCDGPAGEMFVVTPGGQVTWTFDYGHHPIFRATYYAADYAGLIELIDILNNVAVGELPALLEPVLDVEGALYGLALDPFWLPAAPPNQPVAERPLMEKL
ncbi:MAG: DUF1566 domain-containing protein [Anaerolineae bacterium]|nr:DUF1566 domain-containing protein [Anaerolineae bacterium]